ncbi:MAG: hypothetical protein PVF75_10350, partial [Granulosicoccaceae bacterium]
VKELASISMTLTELSSIARLVNSEIRNGEFNTHFNKMVADIAKSYDVVTINLSALAEPDSASSFVDKFDDRHAAYTACYLTEISKPRSCADDAYEEYLVLKTLKESKTSFPLLKRTFARLDQFVDKWITNDAWLAMSIDNLFKRLQSLLNEIAALKKKDADDAYLVFSSAFNGFSAYLALIKQQRDLLSAAT